MAAQVKPEQCEHRDVTTTRPLTVQDGPFGGGRRQAIGHFLRQEGKCLGCGQAMVRVTELVLFGEWRAAVDWRALDKRRRAR